VISHVAQDGEMQARGSFERVPLRVLCLGNDLMADDSLGHVVAEQLCQVLPAEVELVDSPAAGFHLLDYVLGVRRLIVIDTIITGGAPPGTIRVFDDCRMKTMETISPHYVGLFETLALARSLSLEVAEEVEILAVEAADCSTVGGAMHPAVRAAIPSLIRMVRQRAAMEADRPLKQIARSTA